MRRLLYALACAALIAPATAEPDFTPTPRPAFNGIAKPADPVLYREIFALQSEANWQRADRLIADIEDPILMGYVLFQRYMHPTAYRAKWTELRDWLKNYADQPGAWRVYKLAQKRKPRGVAMPKRPPARIYHDEVLDAGSPLFRSKQARRIKYHVISLIRRERPTQALRHIRARNQARRLSETESDFLKSLIARSYYIEGKVGESLKHAEAATRSRANVPMADWHAGLAAWRQSETARAIGHFEALAANRAASAALRARGAFWAARGHLRRGDEETAEEHLEYAARSGAHFYGLLAQSRITGEAQIMWARLDEDADTALDTHPALRRAEVLRAAARPEWGEQELLYLQERLTDREARALLRYAKRQDYPAVQLALSSRLAAREPVRDDLPVVLSEGLYPELRAAKNLTLDRAIVFALIRQESRFKARARSNAGARGLMQLMPHTAAFISGDRTLAYRSGRERLLDTSLNLELGQKYLTMLLDEKYYGDNLVLALAAYNAGPGTLKRWRRELAEIDDPLLFIESVPAGETRRYLQKVLANLWIYRNRLGQEAISQRILANETWPYYVAQDHQARLFRAAGSRPR